MIVLRETLFKKGDIMQTYNAGNYDVIVNGVLWDTTRKDHIIYKNDLANMRKDSMIVDISCDRQGGIETSIPTTLENPVYYVQYAHARICSLISALKEAGYEVKRAEDTDLKLLDKEVERELIKKLSQLPEEIKLAARDYDPSRINRYVIDVAAHFHRFYNECRIKGESDGLVYARLLLASCTAQVIRNCLGIIGVTAPEKM